MMLEYFLLVFDDWVVCPRVRKIPPRPPLIKGGWGDFKSTILAISLLLFSSGSAQGFLSFQEVQKSYVKSDSLLLDREGEVLHEMRTDWDRRRLDWAPIESISPALIAAVIQAEDKRFNDHPGVDYKAIGAALFQGLTSESIRGASTITMQLVSLLDQDLQPQKGKRSLGQKAKQGLAALKMERSWPKKGVLEAYLNRVTFRGELQGIGAASRFIMGKDPHGLDRVEALILASFLRSPNGSAEVITKRAVHLGKSLSWSLGDQEVFSKVRQIFLGPNFPTPRTSLAPHIARRILKDHPEGSSVLCTLDGRLQRFALDCVSHHLLSLKKQNANDGAVLILENKTGKVLAYVSFGGNPSQSRFVDGVQAKRQAGSILKPFLYGLAFEQRFLTPASLLYDSPLDLAVPNGVYHPRNYNGQFQGLVTARTALASSLNIPAVEVLSLVGLEPFLNKLRKLGLKGLKEGGDFYGPSLAVGSADVSLWELVNAYRTLADGGKWLEPSFSLERKTPSQGQQIFSREAAFLVSDILSDRQARSVTFGLENPLATRFWTAVKTGTSKDMRDNWCVGYSHEYTVGVWVGNFSGEPMWNVSGITGAAPIWAEIMNYLHRNAPHLPFGFPQNLVRKQIDFPQGIEPRREEWFIRGTEPLDAKKKIGQQNQRILYPPAGSVIVLDPDIPPGLQRVFLTSQIHGTGCQWILNGKTLKEDGNSISWTPVAGKYTLVLADGQGHLMDSVSFVVRGNGQEDLWFDL